MKHFFFCLLVVSVLAIAGCGENIRFGGKVVFDDGAPLTTGTVCFETDSFVSRGDLRPDGTYTMGSLKERDGLPAGTYRVYLVNAEIQVGTDQNGEPIMKSLIDEKYTSGATSGLLAEVSPSSKRFDFTVEKP